MTITQSAIEKMILLVLGIHGLACDGMSADESPLTPIVVLDGISDFEMAPHEKGNVYAPCVLLENNRFRMWYGGQGKDGHDRISYAESKDGKKWIRKGVVVADESTNHINDPSVVKANGRYLMVFTYTKTDVVDQIAVATSSNGMKWKIHGIAMAPSKMGAWDSLSVGRPSVLFEDGIYRMWYDGRKDFPSGAPVKGVPTSDISQRHVGYATSKDGLKWERSDANPVFDHDAGAVDVQRIGKTLVMLYESGDGTRLAVSSDGLAWTDKGLAIRKSGGAVDAFGHVTPNLVVDPMNQRHRIYMGSASIKTWDQNQISLITVPHDFLKPLLLDE